MVYMCAEQRDQQSSSLEDKAEKYSGTQRRELKGDESSRIFSWMAKNALALYISNQCHISLLKFELETQLNELSMKAALQLCNHTLMHSHTSGGSDNTDRMLAQTNE